VIGTAAKRCGGFASQEIFLCYICSFDLHYREILSATPLINVFATTVMWFCIICFLGICIIGRNCLLQPFCDFAIVALVFCYDFFGKVSGEVSVDVSDLVSFAKIAYFLLL
jgi:hypothetical protein